MLLEYYVLLVAEDNMMVDFSVSNIIDPVLSVPTNRQLELCRNLILY